MSYQYFNIVNKKTLFLNGPKKWEAYTLCLNNRMTNNKNRVSFFISSKILLILSFSNSEYTLEDLQNYLFSV